MAKKKSKKKNPTDVTVRNVKASAKRDGSLDARIKRLEAQMKLVGRIVHVERFTDDTVIWGS